MSAVKLRDDQWLKIYAFLRNDPRVYAGQETSCRRFVEAVARVVRTGTVTRRGGVGTEANILPPRPATLPETACISCIFCE